MKTKIFLLVVTAAMMLSALPSCAPNDPVPDTIELEGMTLAFSDEFDGSALNEDVWSYDIGNGNGGWGNAEAQYYTKREDNVLVSDGTLKIIAREESYQLKGYTSGRIKTQGKADFGEGYVEARIKLPSERGIWPAFWMMGEQGDWPLCGEIDILESKHDEAVIESTVHWADESTEEFSKKSTQYLSHKWEGYKTGVENKTEWHTYGVYRTKTQIAFYVDGKRHCTIDISDKLRSELGQDCYVLLNVACGGNYIDGVTPTAGTVVQMEVDYVRYYTR